MKLIKVFAIFLLSTYSMANECKAQTLLLKDFKFDGIFGNNPEIKNEHFCLLGQGFFRTPRSDDSDSLLKSWMMNHPKAILLRVSSLATPERDHPDLRLTYCWAIDGKDTLNNYLVRNGCYPGGTMQRPESWDEMSKTEKEIFSVEDKPDVTVHIDKFAYDNFIKQIYSADQFAKDHKLGIWGKSNDEE